MASHISSLTELELEEWKTTNAALRQHGMMSVELTEDNASLLITVDTSRALRDTLNSLMRDCDRRQQLVKELVSSSNHLREELRQQTSATEKYEAKSRELRVMLDSTMCKVDELERLLLESGQNAPNAEAARIQLRYKQLESRNHRQEVEIAHLKDKLNKMHEEEEKRMKMHKNSVSQLKKRIARSGTLSDDRVVDIMDSYEREVHQLRQQLQAGRSHEGQPQDETWTIEEASPDFKAIIRSYEKELKDCKKKTKQMENEKELVKLELHSRTKDEISECLMNCFRPEIKDLRDAQYRIKKLERIIKNHNLSTDTTEDSNGTSRAGDKFNKMTKAESNKQLKRICSELGVDDVSDAVNVVKTLAKYAAAYPKLEQFANDVLDIVSTGGAPVPPNTVSTKGRASHEVWCEKTWHHVIPTLHYWLMQLQQLKAVDSSLKNLQSHLHPWKSEVEGEGDVTVEGLLQMVENMVLDDGIKSEQPSSRKQKLTKAELERVVDHFMNLFDVSTVSGIFTRMNDIYTKLGEVHNVMRTLRHLLTLEDTAKSNVIVDAVVRLVESHNQRTSDQLKQLLEVEDIDQILRRLHDYEEFFPAFQEVMQDLMDILAVSSIDQVVPNVRLLKLQSLS